MLDQDRDLNRNRDRLWGNRDPAETGRDARTPWPGWGDRTGSGAGRSPGDRGGAEQDPARESGGGGHRAGGCTTGDRDGMRDRDTGLGGGVYGGGVGLGMGRVGG